MIIPRIFGAGKGPVGSIRPTISGFGTNLRWVNVNVYVDGTRDVPGIVFELLDLLVRLVLVFTPYPARFDSARAI